ncbi:hypothetical protein T439DRAFT_384308 [Meredithblackwellia eburnea MCA 4105]
MGNEGVFTLPRRFADAGRVAVISRLLLVVVPLYLLMSAARDSDVNFSNLKSLNPSTLISSTASSFHPRPSLPRAALGQNETFTDYLDARWPDITPPEEAANTFPSSKLSTSALPPHLWITLAGSNYVDTGLAALNSFVDQLNEERAVKFGRKARRTVVVALCLDESCVQLCDERKYYCWGGYEYTRPEQILQATWPKLAGMMEVLQKRDVFFVDADVFFRLDPYPYMLPLMEEHDLVIQEEGNEYTFNTGWFWMRRGPASIEAWKAVLEMDMQETSRDQRNMNKFMNTTSLRFNPATSTSTSTFVSPNGLRVKVLDPEIFFSFHFEAMLVGIRPDAVYIHGTCVEEKFAMAKHQGFWGDINGYYSTPRQVLTFDHHAGDIDLVSQMARIVLSAARYSGRAFQPPPTTTFTKVVTSIDTLDRKPREYAVSRRPYYSFPYERIGEALGINVVEAGFHTNSARHLLGRSVLDHSQQRLGWTPGNDRVMLAADMLHVTELDIRIANSLADLVTILRTPRYSAARVIKLVNWEWPDDLGRWENWRYWVLPGPMGAIVPCQRLDSEYLCSNTCGWAGVPEGSAPWPTMGELLQPRVAARMKRIR